MDYLIFLNYSAENSLKMHDSAYLQNFSTDVYRDEKYLFSKLKFYLKSFDDHEWNECKNM